MTLPSKKELERWRLQAKLTTTAARVLSTVLLLDDCYDLSQVYRTNYCGPSIRRQYSGPHLSKPREYGWLVIHQATKIELANNYKLITWLRMTVTMLCDYKEITLDSNPHNSYSGSALFTFHLPRERIPMPEAVKLGSRETGNLLLTDGESRFLYLVVKLLMTLQLWNPASFDNCNFVLV